MDVLSGMRGVGVNVSTGNPVGNTCSESDPRTSTVVLARGGNVLFGSIVGTIVKTPVVGGKVDVRTGSNEGVVVPKTESFSAVSFLAERAARRPPGPWVVAPSPSPYVGVDGNSVGTTRAKVVVVPIVDAGINVGTTSGSAVVLVG